MNTKHAESQILDGDEVIRLFESALRSPEHRTPPHIVECRAVSTMEMIALSSMTTPEGSLHIVGEAHVVSGERYTSKADGKRYPATYYTDLSDALAVWNHLVDEAKASGTAK